MGKVLTLLDYSHHQSSQKHIITEAQFYSTRYVHAEAGAEAERDRRQPCSRDAHTCLVGALAMYALAASGVYMYSCDNLQSYKTYEDDTICHV